MSNPPLPIPNHGAFVPGEMGVAGVTRELINLPNIMLAGALIMAIRVYLSPKQAELAMGKNECMTKYCPGVIHPDKPLNTLSKDQSLGIGLGVPKTLPTKAMVDAKVHHDYRREQLLSPGVQLVAHAVRSGYAAAAN